MTVWIVCYLQPNTFLTNAIMSNGQIFLPSGPVFSLLWLVEQEWTGLLQLANTPQC